ncbi:hypothetical protein Psta_0058 [Pirellula staleyi DSM 6068]|mgnify:CR=1 FL=1|uniref:Uncharacterized protein n=1 Tax=Pirellula staleyi (strain ATCC 27377 / DSM 6068 / ICPB 4128) TaxID=530564 RepID=D2QZJ7_PIRSD|nr:hypothetical protein [Pirellula staleyi]ADB14755.1 hypothetical protein Psta_0058 [Pirellula staleyi DSM 6068]
MLPAMLISLALTTTAVPPGEYVENHAGVGKFAQPTIRRFERREEDRDRRAAWDSYTKELDLLWTAYRTAGSTPAAWRKYLTDANEAKRRYVWADPYLVPIVEE